MEWWQILLIGIASIGVGILLGILVDNLLKRFAEKREATRVIEKQVLEAQVTEEQVAGEQVLEAQAIGNLSDLIEEINNNLKIATGPWTGKLIPFQTHIWDTRQDLVNAVPASLKEHLAQAYTDIRLANSVVWLSMELGRRSDNLIQSYMKLRTSIATELSQVKPLLKQ